MRLLRRSSWALARLLHRLHDHRLCREVRVPTPVGYRLPDGRMWYPSPLNGIVSPRRVHKPRWFA